MKKLKDNLLFANLITNPIVSALLLSLAFAVLYAITLPTVNVGYGDSDALIAVAKNFGVVEPPGYPIYTFLLGIFANLPLPVSVAARAHLLSLVFSVVALFVTFNTAYRLYPQIKSRDGYEGAIVSHSVERWLVSVFTLMTVGLSTYFWLYAGIAEKYAYSSFLISLALFSAVSIATKGSKIWNGYLYLLALTAGLVVSHHYVLAIVFIPIAYYIWTLKPNFSTDTIVKTAAFALTPIIISVGLLWWSASRYVSLTWPLSSTLPAAVTHLLTFDPSVPHVKGYIPSISQSTIALQEYAKILFSTTGWGFVLLIFLALRFGFLYHRNLFIMLAGSFVAIGLVLAVFLSWPGDFLQRGLVIQEYIPSLIPFALLLIFGWIELLRRFANALALLGKVPVLKYALLILPLLALIGKGIIDFPKVDLSRYHVVSTLYKNALTRVPHNTLLTCYSHISCNALHYEQVVNGTRPDVTIIPLETRYKERTLNSLKRFVYDKNPLLMLGLVATYLDKRPVYTVDFNKMYYDVFGVDRNYMFYIPRGHVGELTRSLPKEFSTPDFRLSELVSETPVVVSDNIRRHLFSTIAQDHFLNGYTYQKMGFREYVAEEFNQGVGMYYLLGDEERAQAGGIRASMERTIRDERFKPGSKVPEAEVFLKFAKESFEQKYLGRAISAAMGAVVVNPENKAARIQLAEFYEQAGDLNSAKTEYENALIIDPTDPNIRLKLAQLN